MRVSKTYFDGINPTEYGISSITLEIHATFVEPEPCKDDIPWTGIGTKTYWTPKVGFRSLISSDYCDDMSGLAIEKDNLIRLKNKTLIKHHIELFVLDGRHRCLKLVSDKNMSFEENLKRALLVRKQFTKFSVA